MASRHSGAFHGIQTSTTRQVICGQCTLFWSFSFSYYYAMSSTETDGETGVPGRPRKRQRNVENWKRVKVKRARNKGEAYTSCYHNQPHVPPAREVKRNKTKSCIR